MKKSFNQRKMLCFFGGMGIIIFLGIHFIIYPLFNQFLVVRTTEKRLGERFFQERMLLDKMPFIKKQWETLHKQLLPYFRLDNKTVVTAELMSSILRGAEFNGLIVQCIQPATWQLFLGMNTLDIHLLAKGKFMQFVEFVRFLAQYVLPIELSHFVLHAEQNGLIQMDLYFIGFYMAALQQSLLSPERQRKVPPLMIKTTHDPFVANDNDELLLTDQPVEMNALLRTVSLRQIKWVGFMRAQHKMWSLAMLPNGKTVEVTEHSVLGLENAHVLHLSEREVVVDVDGHLEHLQYSI